MISICFASEVVACVPRSLVFLNYMYHRSPQALHWLLYQRHGQSGPHSATRWVISDKKSLTQKNVYIYWNSLPFFGASYAQAFCDIRVLWLLQYRVEHLTLWFFRRSLAPLGLHAVRSGACSTLVLGAAYSLVLWLTCALTVQFIFNCCPAVAKNTSYARSHLLFVESMLRVGYPR